MAPFRGIPIRLATYDEKGTAVNYEVATFATARQCPRLLELLRAVTSAGVYEDAAASLAGLARRRIFEADSAEAIDAARADALKEAANVETATAAYADAVRAFILAGFTEDGYTEEQAERYANMAGTARLAELKAACLVGLGRLDFTTALPSR